LVLDRSTSMRQATATGTRWSDLTGSLANVLVQSKGIHWGLKLFPRASSLRTCEAGGVEVSPYPDNVNEILNRIQVSGQYPGTPTRKAVTTAAALLASRHGAARRYLLLATDGLPNCAEGVTASTPNLSDDEGAIGAVRDASGQGISTFVIGLGTTDGDHETLSRMAVAGGHGRRGQTAYFVASSTTDLSETLKTLARQIAVCTLPLETPSPMGAKFEVSVDGRSFSRDRTRSGDGWDVSHGGKAITLYGAACDSVQSQGRVTLRYRCPAQARDAGVAPEARTVPADAGAPDLGVADAHAGADSCHPNHPL
jgi:hypothetical protein